MTDKLVWLDLETFGLEAESPIIEVGLVITNLNLVHLNMMSWLCWESDYQSWWTNAPAVVREMHGSHGNDVGLASVARTYGRSRDLVEKEAVEWLVANNATGLPMCGNSLGTDKAWLREQMPNLLDAFHYRVIDVSSFKEACRHYNPPVFAQVPEKGLAHRALGDLRESIAEFKFYRDNFFFDARED